MVKVPIMELEVANKLKIMAMQQISKHRSIATKLSANTSNFATMFT